jgi:hypothetical protein
MDISPQRNGLMPESSTPNTGSPPRLFTWRAISAIIVAAIGVTSLISGVGSLCTHTGKDQIELFDSIWNIFLGSCFIASSILLWKGRWRLAVIIIAACLLFPLLLFLWAYFTT